MISLVLLYRRLRYGCAFRKIPLTQGKFAIVDPDDYEKLSKYNWYLVTQHSNSHAKRRIKVNGKWRAISMHREILNVTNDLFVDHRNHNGLDNRKANLRPATPLQNAWNNLRKKGKNRFRGVIWNRQKNKWRVQIINAGRHINIGYFTDELEAAKAYDQALKKYRGQFAVLNFD